MSTGADSDITAARIGAVSTKQAALIGLVAVVLSAGLSVGASYWSADKAADATLESAQKSRDTELEKIQQQLSGETEKSRAEFLRGQRQTLYATVASDEQNLTQVEDRFFDALLDGDGAVEDSEREKATLIKAERRLRQNEFTISIIGSKPARAAFTKLLEAHDGYLEALDNEGSGSGWMEREGGEEDMIDTSSDLIRPALLAFQEAARADMGNR